MHTYYKQNVFLHTDAPVYLSFPHFYEADPVLLEPFIGLKPDKEKHETYFKIQPVSNIVKIHFPSSLNYLKPMETEKRLSGTTLLASYQVFTLSGITQRNCTCTAIRKAYSVNLESM